jgi:hypothetical protein
MHMPDDIPKYFATRCLWSFLGISWHAFTKYRKRGVIPEPDDYVSGKPLWLNSKVKDIRQAVDAAENRQYATA